MEARDPLQTVRWEGAALLGVGAGNFGHLAEDAHSAAAPDGTRWHRAPHRSPSGTAQGGILPDRLGPSALPCARRVLEVGGTTRSARRNIVRGGIPARVICVPGIPGLKSLIGVSLGCKGPEATAPPQVSRV